ncbi:MAG: TauD/TfdA dioxygenase family protein [Leptolyngbyaceae cyanobacterium]
MENGFRKLWPFGAEAVDIDITATNREDIEALKQTLAYCGVVILRQQWVTDDDFVAFLKQLGPLTFTVGETPVPDQPSLNRVSNVGRTHPPRSVFHTDTSYVSCPPAYTALRAVTLPQSGGDTLFSNQYRALETLPDSVKVKLAETQVLHVVSGLTLGDDQETQSWHSLFRRHPLSGRKALYLSTPERCRVLSGFDPDASQRAIRLLYRHSIRPYRRYRHRWQPGDVVIWDNRCTMHRADHSAVVGDRVLHRGLVADELGASK